MLKTTAYKIGWICAIEIELSAARLLLDKEHKSDEYRKQPGDDNSYIFGNIGEHNIVIATLPGGEYGTANAAAVIKDLIRAFPHIKVGLMVGIAGGAPLIKQDDVLEERGHYEDMEMDIRSGDYEDMEVDIRLGDVIVSEPGNGRAGVHPYRFGQRIQGRQQLLLTGHVNTPPRSLSTAVTTVKSDMRLRKLVDEGIDTVVNDALRNQEKDVLQIFGRPDGTTDRLYISSYVHSNKGRPCSATCTDSTRMINRAPRSENARTEVHYGLIASADELMRDAIIRDELARQEKVLCFEMESAGLMNLLPFLVIRGVCDYSDSHRSEEWQGYAAMAAAAYARKLLLRLSLEHILTEPDIGDIVDTHAINEAIHQADTLIRKYYRSSDLLWIKRLSGEKLELEKCYINLSLIDQSEGTKKEQKTSSSLEARLRLDASEVGKKIPLEHIFKLRKLASRTVHPRRIFIQGRAGIGKTTLCKKIVHEFLEGRLEPKLFDRLLWVPLRGLKRRTDQEEYGWQELLQDTFRMATRTWKKVESTYREQFDDSVFLSRTLFLFDGLDEISSEWRDEDPFCHFINRIIHSLPNVIITSRPQANTFSLRSFDLDLETIGFTTDQISTYISNCVRDSGTVAKMERLIAHKPLIRGLLRIPIQLDAFCYIWHEEFEFEVALSGTTTHNASDIPITMTTLYQAIVIELCKKDLNRLGKLDQPQRPPPSSEIEDKLIEELGILQEIAFHGLFNNVVEFSPQYWDTLGNYFYKTSADSTIFRFIIDQLSFLRTSDRDGDNNKRTYHFIHLTFQEFFAARHFTEHWQSNRALTYLIGRGKYDTKTPLVFLQEEKYNPRYNIFWRFVAGLLSEKQDVTFFQQLDAEPRDLLGTTHLRLTMYCFSEVISSNSILLELCTQNLHRLRQGLKQEFSIIGTSRLGLETEFPEEILIDLLENDIYPCKVTLSLLKRRSVLKDQTIEAIARRLASSYTFEVRLEAAKALWSHSTVCTQQTLERAIHVLAVALDSGDYGTRDSVMEVLEGRQLSLSEAVITILIAAFEDLRHNGRYLIIQVLRHQSSLPEAAINFLIVALEAGNFDTRICAAEVIGERQSSLSEVAIIALIAAIQSEDPYVQWRAALAIAGQQFLPEAATTALTSALDDQDCYVQSCAAVALGKMSSLSKAADELLVAALKEDRDFEMRLSAAKVLAEQPSLSDAATIALVFALKDETNDMREVAEVTLIEQSPLSEAAVNVLIPLLKNEDILARASAAVILGKQSFLPETILVTLISMLEDEHWLTRRHAVQALGDQSYLPKAEVKLLIPLFRDISEEVRYQAEAALAKHPSLSEAAIGTLALMLNEHSDYHDLQKVLHKQPLFYSMIESLGIQAWHNIWSFWLRSGPGINFSCYEFAGALYLWSDGVRYKIFANTARIAQFRKAVLNTMDDLLEDDIVEGADVPPEKTNTIPEPQPQARSGVPIRKKRKFVHE